MCEGRDCEWKGAAESGLVPILGRRREGKPAENTSAVCVWADGGCEWPVTGLPENARSICGGIWDLLLRPGRNLVGLSSHVPERSRWRGACVGTSSRLWLTIGIAILMPFVVVNVFKGLRMEGRGGNPESRRLGAAGIHKIIRWLPGGLYFRRLGTSFRYGHFSAGRGPEGGGEVDVIL
jgi:hypothetical protein